MGLFSNKEKNFLDNKLGNEKWRLDLKKEIEDSIGWVERVRQSYKKLAEKKITEQDVKKEKENFKERKDKDVYKAYFGTLDAILKMEAAEASDPGSMTADLKMVKEKLKKWLNNTYGKEAKATFNKYKPEYEEAKKCNAEKLAELINNSEEAKKNNSQVSLIVMMGLAVEANEISYKDYIKSITGKIR